MKLGRWLGLGLFARRTLRELGGIHVQLTRQNDLLERLVQRLAPVEPAYDQDQVRRESGVEYVNAIEGGVIFDYIERTRKDVGREPTEEEILEYLADEKTIDLQQRMSEREQTIAAARARERR